MGAGSLSTALHSGLAEAQASGATHAYPNEHASLKKTCDKNASFVSVSDVLAFRRQWLLDAKAHKNQAYVHKALPSYSTVQGCLPPTAAAAERRHRYSPCSRVRTCVRACNCAEVYIKTCCRVKFLKFQILC